MILTFHPPKTQIEIQFYCFCQGYWAAPVYTICTLTNLIANGLPICSKCKKTLKHINQFQVMDKSRSDARELRRSK